MKQTVVVLFDVDTEDRTAAEAVVEERLAALSVLQQNDSSDIARGTLDPIVTYVVVPANRLLDESV